MKYARKPGSRSAAKDCRRAWPPARSGRLSLKSGLSRDQTGTRHATAKLACFAPIRAAVARAGPCAGLMPRGRRASMRTDVVVDAVIAGEPACELATSVLAPLRVDRVDIRGVDRELDPQPV